MRTRLRSLRTGGRQFTWRAEIGHVQGELDCHRCIRLSVWGAGKNSRPLRVDLLSKSWPAPFGACASDDAYPTPADVRVIVEYAVAAGWELDAIGGVFLLPETVHGGACELPGFLLTDRPRDPSAADPSA